MSSSGLILPDIRSGRVWWACGATAAEIVCRSLGIERTRGEVRLALPPDPHRGTPPERLVGFFKGQGLRGAAGTMEVEDLRHYTRERCPVVCPVQTADGWGHYVVVYRADRRRVYYQDPETGPVAESVRSFLSGWIDYGADGKVYERYGIAVWR